MKKLFNLRKQKIVRSFPADASALPELLEYTHNCFTGKKINEQLAEEYQLLVEEVSLKLIKNADKKARITVQSFGGENEVYLKLKCPGKPVILHQETSEDYGGMLIEEYQDYLKQSYGSGNNQIIFTVSSDSLKMLKYSFYALVISLVAYLLMNNFCSEEQVDYLVDNIFVPFNYLFVSFLRSLATPMIFFSIAALVTKLWLKFENNGRLVKLFGKYLATSIIASLIGFFVVSVANNVYTFYDYSEFVVSKEIVSSNNLSQFIEQFSFEDILSPFESANPIPMIILAIVTGLAASMIFGKRGIAIRHSITSLSSLFEKMFNIVYKTIPFFLVFSLLLNFLEDFEASIFNMFGVVIIYFVSALIMFLVYSIQLLVAGVNPSTFFKEYKDIILNNLKIGSNINALPYNKRALSKKVHLNTSDLEEELKLGTMVNMDGSCLVVAINAFYLVYAMHLELTPAIFVDVMLIAILISIGSPNEPGSFLLGGSIIMGYLGLSTVAMCQLIINEVLLGIHYSGLNSIGDIVTVAAEDALERKKKRKKKTQR